MNVLIACEYSGVVRDAFTARGHYAVSCDLLPTESNGPHHRGDVRDLLGLGWGMMIAHPDCTYLCGSGLHWNGRTPGREEKTLAALDFVRLLMAADIPRIAIENPVGCISTCIDAKDYGFDASKAAQYIQPYEYGHDASKKTGLWLKGLPRLIADPDQRVPGRIVGYRANGQPIERWSNQTDSGQNRLGPSDTRWQDRARTYQGIADAMAAQWSA